MTENNPNKPMFTIPEHIKRQIRIAVLGGLMLGVAGSVLMMFGGVCAR